ncbi:hypothetical protein DSCO28_43580 [Desulfosarcina ovata subsp. sediminis]|uniref:Uncharacterized protein n=1 Tax=Desulfosarcina ovata subsp. sediminis TaxID=885957 RepID=A0A5K7ZU95_9BACT|nr:hypothetical protein [Desulfosarcina ovata]BBO83792.1 hypothetical protein DSCO28_43580 [Desulfosarcina ovata subsp. sediminis]
MKNSILLIIFLFLVVPSTSHGKWNDKQGNPVEDTEWMKYSGDFGAQLLLIGDEKEFFKCWETPSETVNLETVSEINRGEPLITPIIFSGCYVNKSGNCMVSAALKILRPDGSTYADMPQVEVWENKPPPPKGILEMGVGYLKVIIEPEDPDGTYTVQAKVKDNVKNSSFVLTRTFSVPSHKEAKPNKQPDEEAIKELSQWFTYYYKASHSAQHIENINKMFQSGFFNKPSAVAPLIMFLAEFFRQNENMISGWEKSLHEIPQDENFYLLHSLWQANTDNALTALNNWPDLKSEKIIEKIKERPPVDLKTIEINSPAILDMLWATFMASGNILYVERIISSLSLPTDSKENDKRISNLLIVGAAKWSLSSNAMQHGLVFKTCQKFTESKDPKIRKAISEILEKVEESKAQQTH